MKRSQSFLKGALIISVGGFVSKLLGAIYRIPLTAFLGGKGMGIYQLVYPLYCILLTISASGIPTGIARLTASGKVGADKTALRLYGAIGLLGSIIMFALSTPLALLQGEEAVANCCRVLSPSVFFVSLISVVRGYYQGKGDMYPTAFSEVLEQTVKVVLGASLAYIYRANVVKAVTMAVFSVTFSEVVTAVYTMILYFTDATSRPLYKEKRVEGKTILSYTVPLAVTALAFPLSQLVESIVIVRLLGLFTSKATALYGIYSGCAVTIINLPVSVTYGIACASVPKISAVAEIDPLRAKALCKKSLVITFWVSLFFAVMLALFAPLAVNILFRSLVAEEKTLLINLVRATAINAVTLSLIQSSSACLTSLGKPSLGALTQWLSSALRVVLSAVLIYIARLSIFGAAISANLCYLFAVLLNFCYIINVIKIKERTKHDNFDRARHGEKRFNAFSKKRT